MFRYMLVVLVSACVTSHAIAKDSLEDKRTVESKLGDTLELRLPAEVRLQIEEAKLGMKLKPATPYSDRDRGFLSVLLSDRNGWYLEARQEWDLKGERYLATIEARIDPKSIKTEPLGMPAFTSDKEQIAYLKAMLDSPPKPRRYVDISSPENVKVRIWRLEKNIELIEGSIN